jgi:acetyltransferase-like isoleucine patch superfamily enzyme
MFIVRKAYQLQGVNFTDTPRYIHYNAFLDAGGGLTIGKNIVISTDVIILTHDYSYTTGLISINKKPPTDICVLMPVFIGDNCFIGARVTILPGAKIGSNVIIGAGSVVKGMIPDNSVIFGNPAKVVAQTNEWVTKFEEKHKDFKFHIDKK